VVTAALTRRLRTARPVDLHRTFGPLVHGRFDPSARFTANAFWRASNAPGGTVTTRVRADPSDGAVVVDAWGDGAAWAVEHAPDLVGLDDDRHDALAGFATDDPVVAPLLGQCAGLRLVRTRAVADIGIATVIEQRVTGLEARRVWARLVRRYGTRAPAVPDLMVPPAASLVAALADHTRHDLGIEGRRGAAMSRLAAEADALDRAAQHDDDTLIRRLRSLPGVGPWTTATVVHLVQGHPDAVPVGDWHFPRHVAYALAGERVADDARMLELLEPFRPFRGYVLRLILSSRPGPPRRVPRAVVPDRLRHERDRARTDAPARRA
jgi:3-methyladenine DNA glycosylase/8-oxoguanine DNA glycosylase